MDLNVHTCGLYHQAEFQPISTRIGEVLEKIVAPLVCHTLELKQLQACHVFNWKKELQLPSVSVRGVNVLAVEPFPYLPRTTLQFACSEPL